MSLTFKTDDLSQAEVSLIGWQFGYSEDDDPYYVSLWHTINRAWVSDHQRGTATRPKTAHMKRLGAAGAYPDEVAVYLKFKSPEGEKYWLNLLKRAGLSDRRQRSEAPPTGERRKRDPIS